MTRIDLANGQWADLRDPASITEAGRRAFRVASAIFRDGQATAAERGKAGADLDDYLLAMFVADWSFDMPIPQANIASLLNLPGLDYDALRTEALKLLPDAFVDFKPGPPDEAAPFLGAGTPAVGSRRDNKAGPERSAVASGVADVSAGDAHALDA